MTYLSAAIINFIFHVVLVSGHLSCKKFEMLVLSPGSNPCLQRYKTPIIERSPTGVFADTPHLAIRLAIRAIRDSINPGTPDLQRAL